MFFCGHVFCVFLCIYFTLFSLCPFYRTTMVVCPVISYVFISRSFRFVSFFIVLLWLHVLCVLMYLFHSFSRVSFLLYFYGYVSCVFSCIYYTLFSLYDLFIVLLWLRVRCVLMYLFYTLFVGFPFYCTSIVMCPVCFFYVLILHSFHNVFFFMYFYDYVSCVFSCIHFTPFPLCVLFIVIPELSFDFLREIGVFHKIWSVLSVGSVLKEGCFKILCEMFYNLFNE